MRDEDKLQLVDLQDRLMQDRIRTEQTAVLDELARLHTKVDRLLGGQAPGPVDPGPVDPGPVDPGPVDPGPVDPGPVDPGEPGSGCFYSRGNKIYDPQGNVFRGRGFGFVPWGTKVSSYENDNQTTLRIRQIPTARKMCNLNIARISAFNETTLELNQPKFVRQQVEVCFANGIVPILECHSSTGDAPLSNSLNWWRKPEILAIARDYPEMWVNVANEHNFPSTAAWRDDYSAFVRELRNQHKLTNMIVLDAHDKTGNKIEGIVKEGRAVIDADPDNNTIFSVHPYTFWSDGAADSWQYDLNKGFDTLANLGYPVIVGEFGIKGRDSHYLGTLGYDGLAVAYAAETRGMTWIGWAWNDKDSLPAFNVINDLAEPRSSITAHGQKLINYMDELDIFRAQGMPSGHSHGYEAIY